MLSPLRNIIVGLAIARLLLSPEFGDTANAEDDSAFPRQGPNAADGTNWGDFDAHSDVGPVKHPGSVAYDAASQTYTISGSGTNMWFGSDEFHVVWKRLRGDFILDAQAELLGEGVDAHRKLGWIVRSDLSPDSPYVDVALHGDGLTSMQFRRSQGAETEQVPSGISQPNVLRLEREEGKFRMSVAKFGDEFSSADLPELTLPNEVYVGLFVCAHNADVVERGRFTNVRITIPAPKDFRPYRDYIGSKLEVLEVQTGHRRTLRIDRGAMQAPNWMTDGQGLVYNQNGRLYRFDLVRHEPTEIPTGAADRNNNDHVISADGATLAISHHSGAHQGNSMVFTLPISGGIPKLVTAQGPSYAHGWSPDGVSIIFTGGRDGNFDIFKVRSDGAGQEERLTNHAALDDGSEYSPDGRQIYFNSARSGRMQIWRMNADGSEQKQVTDDDFNNWFPHISPDGQHLVMLSFGTDVAAEDHPWYQRVYLRKMPVTGGAARVIAYLYGGQGTINVPSWSPDGKYIAFVSNTGLAD